MKRITLLTMLYLITFTVSYAQKEWFTYEPRLVQTSLRLGTFNVSFNIETRLSPKTTISSDLGMGLNYLMTNHYNKFNSNYMEYDETNSLWLDFGRVWQAPFAAVQLRLILDTKSRKNYLSAPYANTYTYLGAQLKFNTQEIILPSGFYKYERLRETYQLRAIMGRQIELTKESDFILDIYGGLGMRINYKLAHMEPQVFIAIRVGMNLK